MCQSTVIIRPRHPPSVPLPSPSSPSSPGEELLEPEALEESDEDLSPLDEELLDEELPPLDEVLDEELPPLDETLDALAPTAAPALLPGTWKVAPVQPRALFRVAGP